MTEVVSPAAGQLLVKWNAENPSIAGYNVYFDSGFKQKVATIKDPTVNEYLVDNLLHAVVYTVGVRAFDKDGREDGNTRVVTYELANHLTEITSVEISPSTGNSSQRPESITCTASYQDIDAWQTLKPTFIIKNTKRDIGEVVERLQVFGAPGQDSITYELSADDNRNDSITCHVKVNDGFDDSGEFVSEKWIVPDTPVIATGLQLNALENGEIDITISRGANSGYTDADRDEAYKIVVSSIAHGAFITAEENVPEDEIFSCSAGACNARFKLEQDFFTRNDNPELAGFTYEVSAGDSKSSAAVEITVAPRARALTFDLQVDQEIALFSTLGKSRLPLDTNKHPVLQAKSYSDGNDGNADFAFFRQPQGTSNNKGRIILPPSPDNSDYVCEVSGEHLICNYGGNWTNAQCKYKIHSSADITALETLVSNRTHASGSHFGVAFKARHPGEEGNQITLVFDGTSSIGTIINNWNQANAGNEVDLVDPQQSSTILAASTFSLDNGNDMADLINLLHYSEDDTSGYLDTPYSCKIPCDENGICSYGFIGHPKYFGTDAEFDFAVEVNGILSNYGASRVTVIPNLRAIGYKGLTVQGQSEYSGVFGEDMGISGLNEAFTIDYIEVDPGSYENIANVVIGTPNQSTLQVPFTVYAKTNAPAGVGKFSYRISATQSGETITSEFGTAEIEWYPLPENTGINISAIENREKTFQIALNKGYLFSKSPQVNEIEIKSIVKGNLKNATDDLAVNNLDKIECLNGDCSFIFNPETNFWDLGTSFHTKFQYRVFAQINQNLFVGDDATYFIDSHLEDQANYTLVSEWQNAVINVRPLPRTKPMQFYVKEAHPKTLEDADATLKVAFDLEEDQVSFESLGVEDVDFAYFHPESSPATKVDLSESISSGNLTAITCEGDQVAEPLKYSCAGLYSPQIGFVGDITDLTYTLTVNDSQYMEDNGDIVSDPQDLKIQVRPIPKAKPDAGLSLVIKERTNFNPSTGNLVIDKGDNLGYTHADNLPGKALNISEATTNGTITIPGTPCDAFGKCQATWEPNEDYHGITELKYRVGVEDSKLGMLYSQDGIYKVEVRPLPRANDIASVDSRRRVIENEMESINLDIGSQYTHAKGFACKEVIFDNIENGTAIFEVVETIKRCVIKFTPTENYQGNASITYKVKVYDAVLDEDLISNSANIYLDVFPKPRVAGRKVFVLPESENSITLDLRPNGELGGNLDENLAGFDLIDRKGYSHRRDGNAGDVEKVTDPARGTLGAFSCASGLCTATYDAPPYLNQTEEQFTYKVSVENVKSENANYKIKILPALRPEAGRSVATVQGEAIEITIAKGINNGYESPEDDNAHRIEVTDIKFGTYNINDLDPGDGSKNCDPTGVCKLTYTPNNGYHNPTSDSEEAYIKFKLYSKSTDYTEDIPSKTGMIVIKVRPKPIAASIVEDPKIQGADWVRNFAKDNELTHPFTWSESTIQLKAVTIKNPSQGVVNKTNINCLPGTCELLSFTPNIIDGAYWYTQNGQFASFEYTVTIHDTVLGQDIESLPGTVTIDYRPRPKLNTFEFFGWQKEDLTVSLVEEIHWTHPYFDLDPGQYQVSKVTILNQPNSTSEGTFLSPGSEFDCTISGDDAPCNAIFRPRTSYYFDPSGSPLTFEYKVSVNDPKLGEIDSLPQTSTIKIKPVVTNVGKSVYGVQSVNKSITLGINNGFTYPLGNLPYAPQIVIKDGSTSGAGAAIAFDCSSVSNCTDVFELADDSISGEKGFEYLVRMNDPDLGVKDTAYQSYTINFYPRPVARNLIDPGLRYDGEEMENLTVNLTPGKKIESTFCDPGHASLHKSWGYEHPLCAKAVEVIVPSQQNGTWSTTPAFSCDPTDGQCTGTFVPASVGGSWQGYGVTTFNYQVRIDPPVLSGAGLNASEIAALTSEIAVAELELYPKPWTNGLTSSSYIYAIQDKNITLEVKKCPDTAPSACFDGYTQGYNENASSVSLFNKFKLTEIDKNCISGVCTVVLKPDAGFYSTNNTDLATFDYNVKIGTRTSNDSSVGINIYPLPESESLPFEGIEGEDLTITIAKGAGYSHAFDLNASKISLVTPPADQAAAGVAAGKFVKDGNLIDPMPASNLEDVFTCSAGTCTATFRPLIGTGTNSFQFKVSVEGPEDMPEETKAQLSSKTATVTITIHPKPVSTPIEVVVIENPAGATEAYRQFSIAENFGYTHQSGKQATQLNFSSGTSSNGSTLEFENAKLTGLFSCANPPNNCSVGCVGGSCDMNIQPNAGYYSNTPNGGNCDDAGADCPKLDFSTTVQVSTVNNLYATSDNTAPLYFNVRPRPKASDNAKLTKYAAQGETVTINLKNEAFGGYSHPWFNASAVSMTSISKGILGGTFDCTLNANTKCQTTFIPDNNFVPVPSNDTATITYKVSVTDPLPFANGALGGENSSVGVLESLDEGQINIIYKPYPEVSDVNTVAIEGDTSRTVVINSGKGFSHSYGLEPQSIRIKAGSVSNVTISPTCDAVNLDTTDCIVPCTAGSCSITYYPNAGYAGTVAGFDFYATVNDTDFSPARDLESQTSARVNVDVRPTPKANSFSLKSLSGNNLLVSVDRPDAYTHITNYDASTVIISNLTSGGLASDGTNVDGQFDCERATSSECISTFKPDENFFGTVSFNFQVKVIDNIYKTFEPSSNGEILSNIATVSIDVRPRPVATGFNADFVTLANQSKSFVIDWGQISDKKGWWYPVDVQAPRYELYPKQILTESAPSPTIGSFTGGFVCNTSGARLCASTFTPASGQYGTTTFDYKVSVDDPVMGSSVQSFPATVNIDVRPNIIASQPDSATLPTLKAIQDTTLNWTIENGAQKGFIYPTSGAYADVLATLTIDAQNKDSDGHGQMQPGASCTAGICSGTFTPEAGYFGTAGFKYQLTVTDSNMPSGEQVLSTTWENAIIDVYPAPIVSPVHYYARKGDTVAVAIASGSSLGYTHDRSHPATNVNIVSQTNIGSIENNSFSCTSGTCTTNVTLPSNFFSASASNSNAASVEFKVSVTEPGASPRVVESQTSSTMYFHVYPVPIATPVTASHANKAIWVNETETVTINRDAGYSHPWPGTEGDAQSLTISNLSGATTSNLNVNCTTGTCTFGIVPDGSALLDNAISFDYLVTTEYAQLTPTTTNSNTASVSYNVRPVPYVPATNPVIKLKENNPIAPIILGKGVLYNYPVASLVSQIDSVTVKTTSGSHIDCSPSSCLGESNAISGSCDSNGDCTLPTLTLESDYNRTQGPSSLAYKVTVNDSLLGTKSTVYGQIDLDVIPMPRTINTAVENGVQDSAYPLTLVYDTHYNHPEGALAQKVQIVSLHNVSGYTENDIVNCNGAGECALTLTPLPGAFTPYASRSKFGNGFGWGKITYRVESSIDGETIWSDIGTAEIRFRAIPKPVNITITNAIEDENEDINPCLKKTTGDSCDAGYTWGYTNGDDLPAISYRVENLSGGTLSSGNCNTSNGQCQIGLINPSDGTITADIYFTSSEGVEQTTPTQLSVFFMPRPRSHSFAKSVVEGETLDIVFNTGSANGFTHVGGKDIFDILITNLSKGSVKQHDGSACAVLSGGFKCVCETSSSACTVKYTPNAWDGADDTPLAGGFQFDARVNAGEYKEKDGNPLRSKAKATVSMTINPRIKANKRDHPQGTTLMGLQGDPLSFSIEPGPASNGAGGYVHNLGINATSMKIVAANGLTTECGSLPCEKPCSSGVCTVVLNPLTGASFTSNASLQYEVYENGYVSHKDGTASIYFYPKPVAQAESEVIVQGSSNNVLTLTKGVGYSHATNDNASRWQLNGAFGGGTLSGWACNSGTCTVNYTPDPSLYSNSPTDYTSFNFDVATAPAIGEVLSGSAGTFNVEIFPIPTVYAHTRYWVEGLGNPSASAGQEKKIKFTKGNGTGYDHVRNLDATKVTYDSVVGGSFSPTSNAFSCSGSTCSATFNPTATSPTSSTPAATFNYRVGVGGNGYDGYLSNAAEVKLIVYPKPTGYDFTRDAIQTTGSIPVNFTTVDDPATNKSLAFSHPWGSTPSTDDNDLTITNLSTSKGTFGAPSCDGTTCTVNFTPADGEVTGLVNFQFEIRTHYATQGLSATTGAKNGVIDIQPAYEVTGVLIPDVDQTVTGTVVEPVTEVPFEIQKGANLGFITNPTSTQANGIIFTDAKIGKSPDSLTTVGITDLGGGTWRIGSPADNITLVRTTGAVDYFAGKFVASNYQFGYIKLQYRVCNVGGCPPGNIISPLIADTSKWVQAYIDPSDLTPYACTKTGTDSVIAYTNRAKTVALNRVPSGENCANGRWYKDDNDGDLLVSYKFVGTDGLQFQGISGLSTCALDGGNTYNCTCDDYAAENCAVKILGTSNGVYNIKSMPTTRSLLLANYDAEAEDPGVNNLTVKVVSPLAPEPKSFTFQVFNDPNWEDPLEDMVPAVQVVAGQAYKTVTEIDPSYLPAPDGYEMEITGVQIDSYSNSKFSNVTGNCDENGCSITPTTEDDANGAATIDFTLTANGVTSASNGTVSMTITPVDDPPQTYANGNQDFTIDRYHKFHRYGDGSFVKEGTFFRGGVGKQITLKLVKSSHAPNSFNPGNYSYRRQGYYDVDDDNAVSVATQDEFGGTLDTPFTCDGNGVCTALWTPTQSGTGRVDYKVTTNGADGNQEQPVWKRIYVLAENDFDLDAARKPAAEHLPVGMEDPDTTVTNWHEIYPAYVIGRDKSASVILTEGTAATDAYHMPTPWWSVPDIGKATSIEIGTVANGAPSDPVNLNVDQADFACTDGTCLGTVSSFTSYPTYPEEAYFWYRINTAENFTSEGYDYENWVKATSDWKRITYKIQLNVDGGCDFSPRLTGTPIFDTIEQGESKVFTVGNGLSVGANYDHTGTAAEWRPISDLEVIGTRHLTATTPSCVAGVCTFTVTAEGGGDSDPNNDYIPSMLLGNDTDPGARTKITLKATDDVGCATGDTTYDMPIIPRIITRNLCKFDSEASAECIRSNTDYVAPDSTKSISFRKRATSETGTVKGFAHYTQSFSDHDSYEYETYDNSKATSVKIFNFRSTSGSAIANLLPSTITNVISGTGTSCTGGTVATLVCTLPCDSSGNCSATLNSGVGYGTLSYDYEVYVDTQVSKGIYTRINLPNTSIHKGTEFYGRTSRQDLFIKARPVLTNINKSTYPNQPIEIVLGINGVSGQEGFSYADSATYVDQMPVFTTLNPTNGSIISSVFDTTAKTQTITFQPANNFVGTAGFSFNVSVFGISSQTLGSVNISVDGHLESYDANYSVDRNSSNNALSFNPGTGNQYDAGGAAGTTGKAIAIEVVEENLGPAPGAEISIGSCDVNGICTVNYTPVATFTGTRTFKFRVQGTDGSNNSWSGWSDLIIDVIPEPVAPVVQAINLVGKDNAEKLVAIAQNSGYTDENEDLASTLHIVSVTGGSLSPSTTDIECTSGICIVGMTRTEGEYGNASFNFQVTADGDLSQNTETVTIDFVPQLTAKNLNENGVRGTNKAISIIHGTGYTFAPGPLVTDLTIDSITGGTVVEGSSIACTSGNCNFTVAVSNDGGVSEVLVDYTLSITSGAWSGTVSNQGLVTIAVAQTDTAPVAVTFSDTLPSHNQYDLDFVSGIAYTDSENDLATTITVISGSAKGGTATSQGCTTGTCTVRFVPDAGYHGEAGFKYTVTANGKVSNTANVFLTVPSDSSASFDLAWISSPSLDATCKLEVPGSVTGADALNVSSFTGTIDSNFAGGTINAESSGINSVLDGFSSGTPFYATWQGDYSSQTVTIGKWLTLTSSTPTNLGAPKPSVTRTLQNSMEGLQSPWNSCTGNSCDNAALAGSIASGDNFSCALMANSSIYCWGENSSGQLGRNNTVTDSVPEAVKLPSFPSIPYYGLSAVTVGGSHACALTPSQEVVCWGSNEYGQLGDGSGGVGQFSSLPVSVIGQTNNPITGIVSVSAGNNHTCAVTSTGTGYCWGYNTNGQLGDGSTSQALKAKAIKKDASNNFENIFSISSGGKHTCAITSDGVSADQAWCWGANDTLQIGDNNTATTNRLYPSLVKDNGDAAIVNTIQIKAGNDYSCSLHSDNKVYCWGNNSFEKTGVADAATNPTTLNPSLISDVSGGQPANVISLSLGSNHACAILANQNATCWGKGDQGQLGDNQLTSSNQQVLVVQDDSLNPIDTIRAISVGKSHTCALLNGGKIRCWGENTSYALATTGGAESFPENNIKDASNSDINFAIKECTSSYNLVP